jgi:hypothetical protein
VGGALHVEGNTFLIKDSQHEGLPPSRFFHHSISNKLDKEILNQEKIPPRSLNRKLQGVQNFSYCFVDYA